MRSVSFFLKFDINQAHHFFFVLRPYTQIYLIMTTRHGVPTRETKTTREQRREEHQHHQQQDIRDNAPQDNSRHMDNIDQRAVAALTTTREDSNASILPNSIITSHTEAQTGCFSIISMQPNPSPTIIITATTTNFPSNHTNNNNNSESKAVQVLQQEHDNTNSLSASLSVPAAIRERNQQNEGIKEEGEEETRIAQVLPALPVSSSSSPLQNPSFSLSSSSSPSTLLSSASTTRRRESLPSSYLAT